VVEVLVRQTQVRQLPLSKGSAMAGVPDGRQLADAAVMALIEKYEIVSQMFAGFDYKSYFSAGTAERLNRFFAIWIKLIGHVQTLTTLMTESQTLKNSLAVLILRALLAK